MNKHDLSRKIPSPEIRYLYTNVENGVRKFNMLWKNPKVHEKYTSFISLSFVYSVKIGYMMKFKLRKNQKELRKRNLCS